MENLATLNIQVVALILAVAMLLAWRVGLWMGRRLLQTPATKPSKFDEASVALLGLLLAFSFGMSIAKHDQRRLTVVDDSNSIGDLYTCASLLKEPARTRLQTVLRQYAQLRIDLTSRRYDAAEFKNTLAKFGLMHDEMTNVVAQALNDGTPIAVSLTNTLNEVTSRQAARLASYRDRLPESIVILLLASAIIAAFLIGREQGADNSSDVAGTVCFVMIVSLAVFVTLDLNQPENGLIRVSQEPMERVLSSMPTPQAPNMNLVPH